MVARAGARLGGARAGGRGVAGAVVCSAGLLRERMDDVPGGTGAEPMRFSLSDGYQIGGERGADGYLTGDDYNAFIADFAAGTANGATDLNNNGVVDGRDFAAWNAEWDSGAAVGRIGRGSAGGGQGTVAVYGRVESAVTGNAMKKKSVVTSSVHRTMILMHSMLLVLAVAGLSLQCGCERQRPAAEDGSAENQQAERAAGSDAQADAAAAEAKALLASKHELLMLMSSVAQHDDGAIARRLLAGPIIEGQRVRGVIIPQSYGRPLPQPVPPSISAEGVPLVDLILLRAFVEFIGEAPPGCEIVSAGIRWHQRLTISFAEDRRFVPVLDSIRTQLLSNERGGSTFSAQWPDTHWDPYYQAAQLLAVYVADDARGPLEALADGSLWSPKDGRVALPVWRGHEFQVEHSRWLPADVVSFTDVSLVNAIAFVTPERNSDAGRRAVGQIERWISRLERANPDKRSKAVIKRARQVFGAG